MLSVRIVLIDLHLPLHSAWSHLTSQTEVDDDQLRVSVLRFEQNILWWAVAGGGGALAAVQW